MQGAATSLLLNGPKLFNVPRKGDGRLFGGVLPILLHIQYPAQKSAIALPQSIQQIWPLDGRLVADLILSPGWTFLRSRLEGLVTLRVGRYCRHRGVNHETGLNEVTEAAFWCNLHSLSSWKHARAMARSAREFAKLVFEISPGSWKHARGMARRAHANLRNWSSKSA